MKRILFFCGLSLFLFSGRGRAPLATASPDIAGALPNTALGQVNGAAFIKAGLSGKGVKIGIIDAGFFRANADSTLHRFFLPGNVPEVKDFIYPAGGKLYDKTSDMDWHGTQVWSLIGGKDVAGTNYGLATDASFYLARTDDGAKEYAGEEENFKQALSWLHSRGVRLVSTSLGYTTGFDNPAEGHVPDDMNGRTTVISRAAEEAILRYDMIIVASAGNDGDNVWKTVSAPADAKDVIAVGATDEKRVKRDFSSEGPALPNCRKPDISCYNYTGGTSFSAPVITGIIACMLQKDPRLTDAGIRSMLQRSGHLYPYGNSYEGYGVPDAARILEMMDHPGHEGITGKKIIATRDSVSLPFERGEKELVLFHKKDAWIVLKQDLVTIPGGPFVIVRPTGLTSTRLIVDDKIHSKYHTVDHPEKVARTTVASGGRVFEIVWP